MKITNNFNLPKTLVKLADTQRLQYDKGADYSVTEIISPPRIQRLRKKHYAKMETDISSMLWQMMGTALHNVAENSEVKDYINEQRLIHTIEGVTLSGAIDVQVIDGNDVTIIDYKFCSVYSVMDVKPEWELQLNIYGWLVNKVKKLNIKKLQICAIIRDWNRRGIQNSSDYPKAPVQIVDIPVWKDEDVEAYIKERVKLHKKSKLLSDIGEELPLCTDEERWKKPTKYAVMKKGAKRAVKLFDDLDTANTVCAENNKEGSFYVEKRVGEAIRCTGNYCGVAEWCSQYNKEVIANQDGEPS